MNHQHYLLDTDILIAMLRDQYAIREILLEVGLDDCAVSEESIAELYYGVFKRNNSEKEQKKVRFIENNFSVIRPPLLEYGKIRAGLETEGRPIDSMDLLIASSAIANNLTLVTHNTKHFSRIPNLKIEDWIGNPEPVVERIKSRYQ